MGLHDGTIVQSGLPISGFKLKHEMGQFCHAIMQLMSNGYSDLEPLILRSLGPNLFNLTSL